MIKTIFFTDFDTNNPVRWLAKPKVAYKDELPDEFIFEYKQSPPEVKRDEGYPIFDSIFSNRETNFVQIIPKETNHDIDSVEYEVINEPCFYFLDTNRIIGDTSNGFSFKVYDNGEFMAKYKKIASEKKGLKDFDQFSNGFSFYHGNTTQIIKIEHSKADFMPPVTERPIETKFKQNFQPFQKKKFVPQNNKPFKPNPNNRGRKFP